MLQGWGFGRMSGSGFMSILERMEMVARKPPIGNVAANTMAEERHPLSSSSAASTSTTLPGQPKAPASSGSDTLIDLATPPCSSASDGSGRARSNTSLCDSFDQHAASSGSPREQHQHQHQPLPSPSPSPQQSGEDGAKQRRRGPPQGFFLGMNRELLLRGVPTATTTPTTSDLPPAEDLRQGRDVDGGVSDGIRQGSANQQREKKYEKRDHGEEIGGHERRRDDGGLASSGHHAPLLGRRGSSSSSKSNNSNERLQREGSSEQRGGGGMFGSPRRGGGGGGESGCGGSGGANVPMMLVEELLEDERERGRMKRIGLESEIEKLREKVEIEVGISRGLVEESEELRMELATAKKYLAQVP